MSNPLSCCDPCATVPPVNVPGAPGVSGMNGTNGLPGGNAYTVTITPTPPANFAIPSVSGNVTISVADTAWMVPGQIVIVQGPANFKVISVTSPTTAVIQFVSNAGDLPPGSIIAVGAGVAPSAVGISAFTNTTSDFVIPNIGSTVPVFVVNSSWVEAGVTVYINGDWFVVDSAPPNSTTMVLRYANVTSNVHGGMAFNVVAGSKIVFGGYNGENAYTLIIAPAVATPTPVGTNVTVNVANSDWMVVGSNVVIGDVSWGKATYQVVSLPTPQSATLTFLGYPGDVASGVTMTVGSRVSVCGVLVPVETHSGIGTGVAFVINAVQRLINLSGAAPTITLGGPGTYALYSVAQYQYTDAYKGHNPPCNVTTAIYRSNNIVGFLANAQTVWTATDQDLTAAQSRTAAYAVLPCIIYTTTTSGDVLELWGWYSGVIDGGTISAVEASVVAIKLSM